MAESVRSPGWVAVCSADDVEPEDVMPISIDGFECALYRSPDGRFFATEGRCTHERARLCEGLVSGEIIECPKHNGLFHYPSGRAVGPPAIVDLRTYPVTVVDGVVYVRTGAES